MGTSVLTECAEDFWCPPVLNERSFSYLVQSDSTVTYFSLALMFLSWSFFNMLSFSQAKVENRKKLSCSLSLLLNVLPGTWSVLTFASRRSLALQLPPLFHLTPSCLDGTPVLLQFGSLCSYSHGLPLACPNAEPWVLTWSDWCQCECWSFLPLPSPNSCYVNFGLTIGEKKHLMSTKVIAV